MRRGRLGDPVYLQGHKAKRPLAQRFWVKVDRSNADGCWPWTGSQRSTGYGQVFFEGKPTGAHRVAWILENGPIPAGSFVLHSCDNPLCVRPSHLRVGTRADNVADAVQRARTTRTIPDAAVIAIRQRYRARDPLNGARALAGEFGTTAGYVLELVRGRCRGTAVAA